MLHIGLVYLHVYMISLWVNTVFVKIQLFCAMKTVLCNLMINSNEHSSFSYRYTVCSISSPSCFVHDRKKTQIMQARHLGANGRTSTGCL